MSAAWRQPRKAVDFIDVFCWCDTKLRHLTNRSMVRCLRSTECHAARRNDFSRPSSDSSQTISPAPTAQGPIGTLPIP